MLHPGIHLGAFSLKSTGVRVRIAILLSTFLLTLISPVGSLLAADAETEKLFTALTEASLRESEEIIAQLEASGGDDMLPLFKTMLDGDLYFEKDSGKLLRATKIEDGYRGLDIFTGQAIGDFGRSDVKKIRVNNSLRTKLREAIARINLNADSASQRLSAVKTIFGELDENSLALIKQRLAVEENGEVKTALKQAVALFSVKNSDDELQRVAAIDDLSGSLYPEIRTTLSALLETDSDGEPVESSTMVRNAAKTAVQGIDNKIKFYGFLEQLFFGLSLGSVLLLAAIGLAITFGVMGVINMAHGEMMMLGAYTTFVIQQALPDAIAYSLLIAIPAAFIVSGSVGILIERTVIRFLHGRPLETLLATFGISLVLQQAVRTVFSPLNKQVVTPGWMSGSLEINSVFSITYNRLYILIFALVLFFVLQLILKKTSLGLNVRAVSQNRNMAKAIGIKTDRVDAMTFGLGSGIAGVAGVALSQLTNVGPNLGQSYIIDSFMVVVFGGVGNLMGTLVGGFTLGIANKFLEPVTGAVLANTLILVFIILFIQKRPKGLFPQKGRAAND